MQQGQRAVAFRDASSDERRRAEALLSARQPEHAAYFVAVARQPVQRIVAVASWEGAHDARDARFDWTVIPGWRQGAFPAEFLNEFACYVRCRGRRSIRARRLVAPRSWEADAFRAAGYGVIARHEHFILPYAASRLRHERIKDRLARRLPAGWSLESISAANSGAAAKLVERHGLLAPDRFWEGIKRGAWQEFSSVLLHDDSAEGILLASASGPEDVSIYVLAANRSGNASAGLICNALFESLRMRCDAADIAGLYFWAEPDRSPATRRLALRFGGRVVGDTVQYGLFFTGPGECLTASIAADVEGLA